MLEWRILTHLPKKSNQSPQTIYLLVAVLVLLTDVLHNQQQQSCKVSF